MNRRTIAADYPSKRWLTQAEAESVLRSGPDPKWLEPWALPGVLIPAKADRNYRFGFVHMYGGTDEPFQQDVSLFWDREGLSWALENLHKYRSKCTECHGLYYFEPDQPPHLRLIVELGDDEEDADEVAE